MAIGIKGSSSGGEFKGHCKYDARAGRMFRADKVQTAGGFEKNDVDITQNALFVCDLANIRVGYINFTTQGPVKVLMPLGAPLPPKPEGVDDKGKATFKQGFEIDIVLHKDCAGGTEGVREFSSTAGCVIEAIDELHDAYNAAPESRQGKLPVVKIASVLPVKSAMSTNYKPIFQIAAWVDRPASLAAPISTSASPSAARPQNGNGAPAHAPAAATPPATGSMQVGAPPPAAQAPQQQPISTSALPPVSAGDFG